MKFWLTIIILICVICAAAPLLTNFEPQSTNTDEQLATPSEKHLFGTDYLGRDVLSRTLYGGRGTLLTAFEATLIASILGTALAALSVSGMRIQQHIMLIFLDSLLAFPGLLLAFIVLLLVGRGSWQIALAVGISQMPFYARIARAAFLSIMHAEYILAAQSIGASRWHIIRYHIIPNARPTLLTYAGMIFSYSIVNSAALSLLGLGQDSSIPDWGVMLADGRNAFRIAPWVALAPGIAITITVIAVNKFIDALNE